MVKGVTVFKAQFQPQMSELKAARHWLQDTLMVIFPSKLSDELRNMITLCFSEIVANTIDYASPPASSIDVEVKSVGSKIHVEIEDDGAPFSSFEQVVEAARYAHDISSLDDRGRGLYLVGNMCRELEYYSKDQYDNQHNKMVLIYDTII